MAATCTIMSFPCGAAVTRVLLCSHDFTDAGAARNVVLGHHDAPVRCLDYSSAHGA